MPYTRNFNGRAYHYDSMCWSLKQAEARIENLKQQGFLVRRTHGSTSLTHSPYWNVWKLKRRSHNA